MIRHSNWSRFCIGAAAAVMLAAAFAFTGGSAIAGKGMVSPKDGCHWDRTLDPPERHWHVEGTKERGGPCVKIGPAPVQLVEVEGDGVTYYVMTVEAEPAPVVTPWGACPGEWDKAVESVDAVFGPKARDVNAPLLCLWRAEPYVSQRE